MLSEIEALTLANKMAEKQIDELETELAQLKGDVVAEFSGQSHLDEYSNVVIEDVDHNAYLCIDSDMPIQEHYTVTVTRKET